MKTFFQDEFEHEINGLVYYIEVEGIKYFDDEEGDYTEIKSLSISDETGNVIDKSDEVYAELKEEALDREYEVENHNASFDYYEDYKI